MAFSFISFMISLYKCLDKCILYMYAHEQTYKINTEYSCTLCVYCVVRALPTMLKSVWAFNTSHLIGIIVLLFYLLHLTIVPLILIRYACDSTFLSFFLSSFLLSFISIYRLVFSLSVLLKNIYAKLKQYKYFQYRCISYWVDLSVWKYKKENLFRLNLWLLKYLVCFHNSCSLLFVLFLHSNQV